MDNNWASEHLQTIRTLMERSALYRRALAPIFTYVGVLGIAAAVVGARVITDTPVAFDIYWLAIALIAVFGSLFLVRRQALRDGEIFWSPPTRRIAVAMAPALLLGMICGALGILAFWSISEPPKKILYNEDCAMLIAPWILFYGFALHAAGFFMPRAIRLFGWAFLFTGTLFLIGIFIVSDLAPPPMLSMGILFGASHLLGGIYLYFTERKNAA